MYLLFKFLHIVAAMIWIGGVVTLLVINARVARTQNRAAAEAMAQQAAFYGMTVLGPASGITLLAGIGTAVFMEVPFNALWIWWGVGGMVLSSILGAVFIRRTTAELDQLTSQSSVDQAGLAALRRRLLTLNMVNLLLLLSVVAAMVYKPA